ncbi:MAG TPA: cupredoxin domain-containing protein, partial [Puia sp.]|nr:cupredoxin domain-containing protein [Puia sp.]
MKTKMFYAGVLAALFAVIVFISCSKSNSYKSGSNTPAAATVSIKNMAFSPGSLSVMAGSTVTWTNSDTTIHTVTADDGSFNSGNIAVGATYSRVFSTAGTFSYHCTLHP